MSAGKETPALLARVMSLAKRVLGDRDRRFRHVLVEPSDYVIRNAGDMSMLEVAVTRLASMWPEKQILVLSDTPDVFPRYRPNVVPLWSEGRRRWREGGADGHAAEFVRIVASSDLLLVAGMGGITDAFPDYAMGVLAALELAMRHGVPTAMMSQGVGPMTPGDLWARAAAVLPHVNRIALREERAGRPLLLSMGVDPSRIVTTGDDAVETAFVRRPQRLGTALGVNVRAAPYSEVDHTDTDRVREGLRRFARRQPVPFVAVPISRVPGEEDASTIRALLADLDPASDGGVGIRDAQQVIEQVMKCRVVMTGSYHAGVFALAIGVSVVGLARSAYYVDKFEGLAHQFPTGCEVVRLDHSELPERLASAIERAWTSADERRPRLVAAAARQVAASQAAYADLRSLVRA